MQIGPERFREQIASLTRQIAGRPLGPDLGEWLNQVAGPSTDTYQGLKQACMTGIAEGWLCQRESAGIKYGRIFKAAEDLSGFSVDVVDMTDVVGPHHLHPHGEIDLVIPVDERALFDGQPAGWVVMPPGSAHKPTVSLGRAIVLYLLPQGAIEFTGAA